MEFSRQEYWSRLPFPTSGYLPNPEPNLRLLYLQHWQADSLPLHHFCPYSVLYSMPWMGEHMFWYLASILCHREGSDQIFTLGESLWQGVGNTGGTEIG